jgi:type V secretory pathway adhesin AidA
MASIHTDALDAALGVIDDATVLHICSSEPADYAGVSSVSLGTATPSFTGPDTGDTSGRKITVDAISDGSVSDTGTAANWALVDGTRLLASGDLSSSQSVTDGNTFTLTAFDIEIQDPT